MDELVELICIKDHGKLRIRIISPGFYSDANVQFPRSIRAEGLKYKVSLGDIKLINTKGKYYYSVKNNTRIIQETNITVPYEGSITMTYEDSETKSCVICMENEKCIIFSPCNHYYCCEECSNRISNCPICRSKISLKLNKELIG